MSLPPEFADGAERPLAEDFVLLQRLRGLIATAIIAFGSFVGLAVGTVLAGWAGPLVLALLGVWAVVVVGLGARRLGRMRVGEEPEPAFRIEFHRLQRPAAQRAVGLLRRQHADLHLPHQRRQAGQLLAPLFRYFHGFTSSLTPSKGSAV